MGNMFKITSVNAISSNLKYYLDLISVLTQKEIKVRYKSSFFGYIWSVAYPLAFSLVFFIAFKIVMKVPMENYTIFLLSGLFPWQWFSNSVLMSVNSFLANASLIKKVNFPKLVIPLVTVLNDLVHFVLSIPVLTIFLLYYGINPSASWIYGIPLFCLSQFLITSGIALSVSSVNLFFRDLERLVAIATTLLFYITPIIYSEEMIPERLKAYLPFNPVALLIIGWRDLFLKGVVNFDYLFASILVGSTLFLFGYSIYRKLNHRFAEVL